MVKRGALAVLALVVAGQLASVVIPEARAARPPMHALARSPICAASSIADWVGAQETYRIIAACVTATGIANRVTLDGSVVAFALLPDATSRHLLNAHNTNLLGGYLIVVVNRHGGITGSLINGRSISVRGPLIHDLKDGWNEMLDGHVTVHAPRVPTHPIPHPTPAPAPASFSVRAVVSPASMPYNAYPTLTAYSTPGATCSASVTYTTGRAPVSFSGYAQPVPASGAVSWSWHEETKGSGGTAFVTCTYQGRTANATAGFTVTG